MVEVGVFGDEDFFVDVLVSVALLSFAVAVVVIVGVGADEVVVVGSRFGQGFNHLAVGRGDLKHGVFLHFVFEPLFQFGNGHLYQLQQEQLLRGELLLHLHGLSLSAFHGV